MQKHDYFCKNQKFLSLYFYTESNGHNNHQVIKAEQLHLVFLTKLKTLLLKKTNYLIKNLLPRQKNIYKKLLLS